MTITIFGAGAIGGTTGAALAQAGHDVLLVDSNAPHVEAINAQGLTVEREAKATTTRVRAVLARDLGSELDLVMLAVKSHHTEDALASWCPGWRRVSPWCRCRTGSARSRLPAWWGRRAPSAAS